MRRRIVIIGAGMGALTAAIRLARRDCHVTVLEARREAGGLAAGFELDGFRFDAGPYVLLDRPGLDWSFRQLGLELAELAQLQRISHVYEISTEHGTTVSIHEALDHTADQFESQWPGSGTRYRRFIRRMGATYARLQPLQWQSRPDLNAVVRTGAWRDMPFLMRSLKSVMARSRLPEPVVEALGVWTHVAGQTMSAAPAPLAMVPAVIHQQGAYYPAGGIGAIPAVLRQAAYDLGVDFQFGTRVARIRTSAGIATGVVTLDGNDWPADAVLSNTGLATYVELLDDDGAAAIPMPRRKELAGLPLQSPGVCVYLAVKGNPSPPYLKFQLRHEPDGCRLLVRPAVLDPSVVREGWSPARLIAPMRHNHAESGGEDRQWAFLEKVVAEPWWRQGFDDVRILQKRIPAQWGSTYHLYRNSMNPVMTAAYMRAGRLAHRSPWIRGLYLAGSATHPGQWVSFSAVSGVLAADELLRDLEG